jgi:hypothetical protein
MVPVPLAVGVVVEPEPCCVELGVCVPPEDVVVCPVVAVVPVPFVEPLVLDDVVVDVGDVVGVGVGALTR